MTDWEKAAIVALIGLVGGWIAAAVAYLWQRRRASDKELFLLLRQAFDRPAFKGPYIWQSDQRAFREAIDITLKAVKTGRHFDRRGQEILRVEGRYPGSFSIRNPARRKAINDVEDRLERIAASSRKSPEEQTPEMAKQIDCDRDEVIRILNRIWKSLNIVEMRLPTEVKVLDEVQDPLS